MRTLAFLFLSLSISAFAESYNLKDPQILGAYTLAQPNKKSEIQRAELVYNNDNVLVVKTDRNDTEYELTGPKGDVVYEGQDEPNCDGEEKACYYDAETTITLLKTSNGPQLVIKIESVDAFDDSHKNDFNTTYVLNWSEKLKHSIPFYTNSEIPSDLAQLVKSCGKALEQIEYDSAAQYLGKNDICPYPKAFTYRATLAEALPYLVKDWVGEKRKHEVRELAKAQVKAQFNRARALAKTYKGKRGGRVTVADILEQIDAVEAYVLKGDRVFAYPDLRSTSFFVVFERQKLITHLDIRVTNKYKH